VALAESGHRTLVIDCDAQANATWTLLGGRFAEPPTLAGVLMRQAAAEDAIRPTPVPNLDVLPADAALSGVNVALVQELARDTRLRSAMAPVVARWDFCILDTAPTFTTILANALVYAAEVIVPVDPGIFAVLGLVQLQETIAEVREAYGNSDLRLAGLLLTKTARTNLVRDVETELRGRFGDLVFQAMIPASTKIEEAHSRGQTVMQYAPRSPGALAYAALCEEILSHGRTQDRGRSATVRGARADDAA
jgi:chromosome partitioning protein